ncbi:bone morphogenetic protein 10 [Cephus cinctus]|uniref:Bone morphogenetic protein 10 n=1 Tax=Cephus cinctus TaxID=211228 RepID=A0AAJ7BQ00_CEPCN|nr:bone morphogenetic protein 10 [Cephus cinctus]
MRIASQYWLLSFLVIFGCYYVWKKGSLSWETSGVVAKASIEVDLSLPSAASLSVSHKLFNRTTRKTKIRKRNHGAVSRYMLQLYNKRADADIVKALQPRHVSSPVGNKGRILEFSIPPVNSGEILEAAELLGTAGMIMRVRPINEKTSGVQRSRRDDSWRAFDVTSSLLARKSDTVRLLVSGKVKSQPNGEGPLLLLSYSKPRKRRKRSMDEEQDENPWDEDGGHRRRRHACRRRPLYVDFATIAYDEWVVAPPGYEAFQCSGKCFYPFGDHLSPTKHAIVQTLVHTALQGSMPGAHGSAKAVGRACCVPTRLAPTSLLYLDSAGTLTYQYGYDDMVVAECGCR